MKIKYIQNKKIEYSYSNKYYLVAIIRIFEYIRVILVGELTGYAMLC